MGKRSRPPLAPRQRFPVWAVVVCSACLSRGAPLGSEDPMHCARAAAAGAPTSPLWAQCHPRRGGRSHPCEQWHPLMPPPPPRIAAFPLGSPHAMQRTVMTSHSPPVFRSLGVSEQMARSLASRGFTTSMGARNRGCSQTPDSGSSNPNQRWERGRLSTAATAQPPLSHTDTHTLPQPTTRATAATNVRRTS